MDKTRVTRALESGGLGDFSMVPWKILKAAQAFGQAGHHMTYLWDKGTLKIATLSKPLIPYLEAWKRFKRDYGITGEMIMERRFDSEKHGLTGKPDRIVPIQKKLTVLEIKFTAALYIGVGPQLAAYKKLALENGIPVKNRMAVRLKESGNPPYEIGIYKDSTDWLMVLHCLSIHNWKMRKGGGKR